MKILGRHTSYNVQKVLWLADELALDYAHEEVGGRFGGNHTKEFLQLNPLGKVPVLVTADGIVRESNTIIRYLADTVAPDTWLPLNAFNRARVEAWMDWSIDVLEPAFVGVFWGHYRTPERQRDQDAIRTAAKRVEGCLQNIGASLGEQPFITGPAPNLADIVTGVFLYRVVEIDYPIVLPANVMQWYQRLAQRPAFNKWVMSDFRELQGRSEY